MTMTRLGRIFLTIASVFAGTLGFAGAAERPVPVVTVDAGEIARLEAYLNGLRTVQARFIQVASDGSYSEGALSLSRPGRMRIDYDAPVPIEIVANRGSIVYHDKKLEQVSYIDTDSTPAGFLLSDRVSFADKVRVVAYEKAASAIRISLVRDDDPAAGSLTLVFADQPLELKKWVVTDAQGIVTTVSLIATRFGAAVDSALFEFTNPYIGKRSE